MRKAAKAISIIMAAVFVLGLMPARAAEASSIISALFGSKMDLTPLKRYEQPVTITVARELNAGGQYAPGENGSNNGFTKFIKDQLNIDIKVKWEVVGGEYNQRLALDIASGDLPDTFSIFRDNMTAFNQLVQARRLADLTQIYNNALGGETKKWVDTQDTKELLRFMTVNNKIYGITGGMEGYNYPFLWIRQDWLDAVGMEAPKTLDDMKKVALAFVDKKPGGQANTIGLAMQPVPKDITAQWFGIEPVFAAVGSFPERWVRGRDHVGGRIIWGSVASETKDALRILNDWYSSGVLDKSFMTMKSGDEVRDTFVNTDACGMVFSAWWQPWPFWSDQVKKDENVQWVPVLAPLGADGKFRAKNDASEPGGQVVSSKCKNPEAVVKAMNLIAEVDNFRLYDDNEFIKPIRMHSDGRTNNPFRNGIVGNYDARVKYARAINEMKRTGVMPEVDATMDRNMIQAAYDFSQNANIMDAWYKDPNERRNEQYQNYYVGHWAFDVVPNLLMSRTIVDANTAFHGATKSMADFWPAMNDIVHQAFVQIISGQKPVDYFDEMVDAWYKAGGDVITNEVNKQASGKK